MVSLTQIQEVPSKNMILLVGPPGSGKSTFCHQAVLSNIEMRLVIYVTTESAPSRVLDPLRQEGLGEVLPHSLGFVDAFHETVGLPSAARPDRLAAEGNAVLACVDEGCGKEEDLIAMMSTANRIVEIELMDGSKTFNTTKHPNVEPTKIEVPMTWSAAIPFHIDLKMWAQHLKMAMGLTARTPLRTEVGDYVNLFWPNFARWCGMLWDLKGSQRWHTTQTSTANPWQEEECFSNFFPEV